MRTKILFLIGFALLTTACMNNNEKKNENEEQKQSSNNVVSSDWQAQYERIDAKNLPDNVIQLISKEWMLVTAGNKNSHNTMTASWGGVGYIWNRPSTFVFVRDSRYTFEFLQREESFTLSFFAEDYREALQICGTKSGRDTDKIKEAGLTSIETPTKLITFAEARMIIECKKTLVQPLDLENFIEPRKSEVIEDFYTKEKSKHYLYISEITNIWIKK